MGGLLVGGGGAKGMLAPLSNYLGGGGGHAYVTLKYQFLIIALFSFDTKEKSLLKHCVCSLFFVLILRFLSVCAIKLSED